jgi:hypothetical protein
VDYQPAQVDEPPLVIPGLRLAGLPEYFYFLLIAEFPDAPLQPVHVGVAGNRGDDKKVRPRVHPAEVQHANFPALMLPQKLPQGKSLIRKGASVRRSLSLVSF